MASCAGPEFDNAIYWVVGHESLDSLALIHELDEEWHSVNPDNVDLLQLLTNLDAPEKQLDVTSHFKCLGELYHIELRSKYLKLFKSFKSLYLDNIEDTRLMEDTIFAPRKCMSLTLVDVNVALAAIDHWKKMDPRTLKYKKLFHVYCFMPKLYWMKKLDMEANVAVLENHRSSRPPKQEDLRCRLP
uniref:BACK domain-containing protein n=1 Tax=Steinernema glaseri TaxID=37863 RepID=A0A1I7Y727_9BILA